MLRTEDVIPKMIDRIKSIFEDVIPMGTGTEDPSKTE